MEVVGTAYGGPEVLTLRPRAESPDAVVLGDDEVLVCNRYAGVNMIDTYYRTGLYKKPSVPYVLGEEGAGTVVRVGRAVPAGEARVGQRVAYFGHNSGSYATHTVVKASALMEIPDGVTEEQAAAVLCQGLTAHYLTHDSYRCTPSSTVLVHAAAGGTGLLLCQMAKLCGAKVVAVCGGPAKAKFASEVGHADVVVDYQTTTNWAAAVRAAVPDGVDAVYDGVGQATFHGSLSVLRPRGSMISFGNASGAVPPVSPLELMRAGSVFLQRPSLGDFLRTPAEAEARRCAVFGWILSGALTVTVGAVWDLRDAGAAHAALEGRQTHGKVLLRCADAA